jgi:Skp family chaperone for outer membrane proteins
MSRRLMVLALFAAGFLVGTGFRPWPTSHAADEKVVKEAPPLRAAHVCMAEFMSKSRKWQAEAALMNKKRAEAAEPLTGLKALADQKAAQAATAAGDARAELEREAVAALEKYQDTEKKTRADIDSQSARVLRTLHHQVSDIVAGLARERNLDAVYAYPASGTRGLTAEQRDSTLFFDMYFRPPAMAPIYVRDSVDLTDEVLRRMDALYEAELRKAEK